MILAYTAIGVFSLNNVQFDLWTLFWFGVAGFTMRQVGSPLAPMIIGVVLGKNAELNLSRAFAVTTDLTPFFSRPWSLFFIILGLFSTFFPFTRNNGARRPGRSFILRCVPFASRYPCS